MSLDRPLDHRSGPASAPGPEGVAHPRPDEHEFDTEPVRGLPERPPEGERILWQGTPSWRHMAWRAFGVRLVLIYFALLGVWRGLTMWAEGAGAEAIAGSVLVLVPVALVAGAILSLMAWTSARASVYTITNRRVAMRVGVVTTVTLNLPFRWIGAASLKKERDGSGDIALSLLGEDKLAYLMLWPHVRPWRMKKAEPALRCLAGVGPVAELLARAMRDAQEERLADEGESAADATPSRAGSQATGGTGVRPAGGLVPAE